MIKGSSKARRICVLSEGYARGLAVSVIALASASAWLRTCHLHQRRRRSSSHPHLSHPRQPLLPRPHRQLKPRLRQSLPLRKRKPLPPPPHPQAKRYFLGCEDEPRPRSRRRSQHHRCCRRAMSWSLRSCVPGNPVVRLGRRKHHARRTSVGAHCQPAGAKKKKAAASKPPAAPVQAPAARRHRLLPPPSRWQLQCKRPSFPRIPRQPFQPPPSDDGRCRSRHRAVDRSRF